MESLKSIILKYNTEFVLCVASVCMSLVSGLFFFHATQTPAEEIVVEKNGQDRDVGTPGGNTSSKMGELEDDNNIDERKNTDSNIYVDISGAVAQPGMYTFPKDTRLHQALEKAGGLSDSADWDFFARNYNVSRTLSDEEKIYVPRTDEVSDGIFLEGTYTITHSLRRTDESVGGQKVSSASQQGNGGESGLIDINSATQTELEALNGVGPVTAEKIISGRPYAVVEDLTTKDILSENVFEKVKSDIAVY